MDLHLDGKKAVVTGSSSGIGASIAKRLAQEGAAVVIHGRNEKEAQRVAAANVERQKQALVQIYHAFQEETGRVPEPVTEPAQDGSRAKPRRPNKAATARQSVNKGRKEV